MKYVSPINPHLEIANQVHQIFLVTETKLLTQEEFVSACRAGRGEEVGESKSDLKDVETELNTL